jgi:MFS family permease
MRESAVSAPPGAGILQRPYLLVTVGACALVFLAAFESLAVTTVMPVVSRELGGAGLYALAFAGPLATGVIGMVGAGNWSDRRGPVGPLLASVAVFALGLLVAGTAGTMWAVVAGRLVQGLGGGAMTVALYVVVARVYPAVLHPRIFAAFSAAWVVPSLVGPFAAGLVAQLASWHWVFLGVVVLVLPALAMLFPALRGVRSGNASGNGSANGNGSAGTVPTAQVRRVPRCPGRWDGWPGRPWPRWRYWD